jgi:putative phosphoesterase
MKILICSDIHGDLESAEKLISLFREEGADKLLILGDILYHGPRNNLPLGYMPKGVTELLNENKNVIFAVRGNCDTEVDQMVLDSPILADYALLSLDGLTVFATHGHKFNTKTPPPLSKGDILLHGHTHIPACIEFGDDNIYLNPGSASMPKENNEKTYMIYEDRCFTLKTLSGKTLFAKKI